MKNIQVRGAGGAFPVGKILCLGRNYAEHAREMDAELPATPVVFLKPASAIIRNGEKILIPPISRQVHHEVELIVAIGKGGKSIPRGDAFGCVLGYGVGLDMTLRDIQTEAKKQGLPWTVAKGFDTSAPVSDIIPAGEIGDPHDVTICCRVNGAVRQQSSTAKMLFRIDRIIEYLSSIFTLEPGDLIFTGTPEGVGEVRPGDLVEAELVGFAKTSHRVGSG
ncbi:MAG: fumarylacetoacetate hydrolase family protein [Ignavibacteria bacterium]|nr:MAG: fumarylacetoacetate hydrolase family protein [Ignavibacteria bacterium]